MANNDSKVFTSNNAAGALGACLVQDNVNGIPTVTISAKYGNDYNVVAKKVLTTPAADGRGLSRMIAVCDVPNGVNLKVEVSVSAGNVRILGTLGPFKGQFSKQQSDGNGVVTWIETGDGSVPLPGNLEKRKTA